MFPGKLSKRVTADRLAWVEKMLAQIRALPLASKDEFFSDPRNAGTAESCLRRALEALFDLGRHIAAKGFAVGATEYKEIANVLQERQVISKEDGSLMRKLAGYRNRMVHFYHEVSADELYEICANDLGDVEAAVNGIRKWLMENPDKLDDGL